VNQAPLHGLLRLARATRGTDIRSALEHVAAAVADGLGYRTVAINLYRPAWDDFEVVVVHGSTAARSTLLGTTSSPRTWRDVLHPRFCRRGAFHVPKGSYDWDHGDVDYVPPSKGGAGDDAWSPEDALFVPLRGEHGQVIGILSVDEPVSLRRPTELDLDVLVAAAGHVALVLDHGQATERAARHRAAVEHLLRASARLVASCTGDEVLGAVARGITDALHFERVAVLLAEADGTLATRAAAGTATGPLAGTPTLAQLAPLFAPEHLREGCVLLDRETAAGLVPEAAAHRLPSRRNGRGLRAWDGHWLLVPLHDLAGQLTGFVWADDPDDRLLPNREQLQALRLFADQAASALESARRLERMRELAERDPLTELPNRRALDGWLERRRDAGRGPVALLVCDLDRFKRVNDELGHEAGDAALVRFAGVLRDIAGPGDLPVRLGGEEFALVLPGADEAAAFAVAERLRASTAEAFAGDLRALTVSVGLVVASAPAPRRKLLRDADRALRVAKRSGRDRTVVHRQETIDALLSGLSDLDRAWSDQLGAVLTLAETLDLRDDATARHSRTVGLYAEQVARELGFDAARVERVRVAGVLHDVGKVGVADATLRKAGPLDADEWAEMRRHPELGAKILANAGLEDVAAWVLAHHERVDGSGYPAGLPAEQIPVEARILAVADAYEAMTADRPYRRALPGDRAEAELLTCAGRQFDPCVVRAFARAVLGREQPVAA